MYQTLTFNFQPTETRTEVLEDIEYTVVPMAMMAEGVRAGTSGPLMYSANELKKTPAVWNGRPLVVYHPMLEGAAISAGDPVVWEKQKVGMVMNTHWNGEKLMAEAWINSERADVVDTRVMEAVNNNKVMEISTGLFTDQIEKPGQHGDQVYDFEAVNYRPDHLALLPDQIGAYSVAEGAGLMVANALSHSNTHTQLHQLLNERFTSDIWVADVYPDFVVFEQDDRLNRLAYSTSDTEIELSTAEPEEVVRVTEYRTVEGAFVGNSTIREILKTENEDQMKKAQIVEGLIANSATQWTVDDKDFLMSMKEDQLQKMAPVANTAEGGDEAGDESDEDGEGDGEGKDTAPATNPPSKPANEAGPTGNTQTPTNVTMNDFLATAPPELAGPLQSMVANHNQQHAAAVERIVGNANNQFSKEELMSKPIEELAKMERLMGAPAPQQQHQQQALPSYAGAAVPTGNTNSEVTQEALDRPTMNFSTADES